MADLKNLKTLVIGGVSYNIGWSKNDFNDELLAKLNGIESGAQVNIIEKIVLNGAEVAVTDKSVDLGSLQKALTAGSGIAIAEDGTISTTLDVEAFKVVDALPDAPAAGNEAKIHVVPTSGDTEEGNVYSEYLWDGSKWELLGEFKADVDLSDYAKTADVNAAIEAVNKTIADNKAVADQTQADLDVLEQTVADNKTAADTGIQEAKDAAAAAQTAAQTYADEKIAEYNTATVQPIAERVTAVEGVASANATKLAGIAEGATKVEESYDADTETLTITITAAEAAAE